VDAVKITLGLMHDVFSRRAAMLSDDFAPQGSAVHQDARSVVCAGMINADAPRAGVLSLSQTNAAQEQNNAYEQGDYLSLRASHFPLLLIEHLQGKCV
jgi:hypothetical protein